MKSIILGNGFVASHLKYPIITDRISLYEKHIENIINKYKPDTIINCIGRTGTPNIDWCESNQEITALTNTALPILLADYCNKKSIHFIHIGSGCLFFSTSPNVENDKDLGWKEDDFANPKSYYSKTKYACDLVLGTMKNVTILRIRMPISYKNNNRNFINKIINYKKIINIPNSVTFLDDFVKVLDNFIDRKLIGIYNVTNPEPISAVDVVQEYKKYVPEHTYEIINEQELNSITLAKRSNCILNTDKLKKENIILTNTKEALEECMKKYIKLY
jgi:dTDP-4-dehydrorhamnose reductase